MSDTHVWVAEFKEGERKAVSSTKCLKESAERLLPPESALRAAILSCPEEVPDAAVTVIAKQLSSMLSREISLG